MTRTMKYTALVAVLGLLFAGVICGPVFAEEFRWSAIGLGDKMANQVPTDLMTFTAYGDSNIGLFEGPMTVRQVNLVDVVVDLSARGCKLDTDTIICPSIADFVPLMDRLLIHTFEAGNGVSVNADVYPAWKFKYSDGAGLLVLLGASGPSGPAGPGDVESKPAKPIFDAQGKFKDCNCNFPDWSCQCASITVVAPKPKKPPKGKPGPTGPAHGGLEAIDELGG